VDARLQAQGIDARWAAGDRATKVGTLSLYARTTMTRALRLLPRFTSSRRGVVKLVVTTTRKLVRLDGLVISAF
jgi:hypothetical protein